MRFRTNLTFSLLGVFAAVGCLAEPVAAPVETTSLVPQTTASVVPQTTTTATAAADTAKVTAVKLEAPELPELTGENFWETIGKGYWFIKHYSPTCIHCRHAAPVWQTLHDFYVTSPPSSYTPPSPNSNPDSPSSVPSFTEAYNFHFGSLNCAAYGDICGDSRVNVQRYPTFNLYKDGKFVETYDTGKNDLRTLSDFVEKYLEIIKPGSRPTTTIVLPAVQTDKPAATKKEKAQVDETKKASPTASKATKETSASKKPQMPLLSPNPNGISKQLDADTFQSLVTATGHGWFIKFYAPWCGHCQAMAPAWQELGKEMRGSLNIGEVNCEESRRLCKDVKVRGYPTIIYFQAGERIEYEGLRGLGDLVSYAKKAAKSGVKEIDLAGFEELESKGDDEVVFLYFYDDATTSEDFAALERLTLSLIGHAPLFKTNSDLLARRFRVTTWPRFIVVRDGKPSYYTALSPQDMRDRGRTLAWMKSVWLPIVPELTAANSHEIMNGRTVVLGILSRNRPDAFAAAKKELKEAAMEFIDQRQIAEKNERQELRDKKELRIEEAEDRGDERALRAAKNMRIQVKEKREVGFAWVDGVFWDRWVRGTYGVNVEEMGERIVINDEDSKKYWDTTIDDSPIHPSRSQILETIQVVINNPGRIKAKSTSSKLDNLFSSLTANAHGHPWIFFGFMLMGLASVALWGRERIRKGRGGFFRLEGGGRGQGKFD
ncbi:hypothetical protein RUND412_010432 [Rhizina undulata]